MRDPEPPDDISWSWLLLGLAMLLVVAPVYAVTRGGSMPNRPPLPRAPLVALTVACFIVWAAVSAIACYAIIRLPEWVGLVMR